MKRKIFGMIMAVALVLTSFVLPTQTFAASSYLSAAQSKYKVTAARTIEAKTPQQIETSLTEAGKKASTSSKYIVHVPAGTYNMPKKLDVPKNVILVAEAKAIFRPTTSSNFTQFFMVYGNVYGGTYECKKMAYYGLRFADLSFKDDNGTIEKTTVKDAVRAGIIAIGNKTQFAYVYNNNVSGCGNSGISAVSGAWIAIVAGNTIVNNTASGVNLGSANINIIKNNIIKNNTGHGISTDIADKSGKPYCKINKIMGNTITGNGVNGVYIDRGCKVTTIFSRNIIQNSGMNGLSVDVGASIVTMAKNTITKNKKTNLHVQGKKTTVLIGNANDFSNAGTNNITVSDGASVTAVAKNNKFNNAKNIGISLMNGGYFKLYGKGNVVQSNGGFGVKVDKTSKAEIYYAQFSGNKGWGVKVDNGGKLIFGSTNLSLSKSAVAGKRVYFDGKQELLILNLGKKQVHHDKCTAVKSISSANRAVTNMKIAELQKMGYKKCAIRGDW